MTIRNETVFNHAMINSVMRASNFDNKKYKLFKLIYNMFGLLFGIMMVRYLTLYLIGSKKSDVVMLWFYVIGTVILLYLGMIGIDKNNKNKFTGIYKKMEGVKFTYQINTEEIIMTDADEDSETFQWDSIIKWAQDDKYIFMFISECEAMILDKNSFTEGTSKDLIDILNAIFTNKELNKINKNK